MRAADLSWLGLAAVGVAYAGTASTVGLDLLDHVNSQGLSFWVVGLGAFLAAIGVWNANRGRDARLLPIGFGVGLLGSLNVARIALPDDDPVFLAAHLCIAGAMLLGLVHGLQRSGKSAAKPLAFYLAGALGAVGSAVYLYLEIQDQLYDFVAFDVLALVGFVLAAVGTLAHHAARPPPALP